MKTTPTNLVTHKMRWDGFLLYIISCNEGTISIEIYDESPDPTFNVRAHICNFWVKQQYRHQGIGTHLMHMAEHIALTNGLTQTFLKWNWRESSAHVRKWYERIGYREIAFGNKYSLYKKEFNNTPSK